jgi:methylated-DNA-protein-cysteine methyltransferase related protein
MSAATEENKQRFYLALASIPEGKVTTYGRLAEQAGKSGRARWAGQMLSHLPNGSKLPWHRVVNSQGKLSFPQDSEQYQQQRALLEQEGVEFGLNGGINLKQFLA